MTETTTGIVTDLASVLILVLRYSIQKRIPDRSTDDRHRDGRCEQARCGKCSGSRDERDEGHVYSKARSAVFHFGRSMILFPMHSFASFHRLRIVGNLRKSIHGFVYGITACSAA